MGASAEWRGDEVTTTERDTVTENALLGMIVPGVRPPYDFNMILVADNCTGHWPGFASLRVCGGTAEIKRGTTGEYMPARLPAWFLAALRDLVLVPDDSEED